jgi:Uma2 family endonuclease
MKKSTTERMKAMVLFDQRKYLPTSDELPCSDDIPVDNEDQNFLPNFLLFLLELIWSQRHDWYFAVDMGVYHTTGENPRTPVIPDGFLSLGVPRRKNNKSRRSYVVWEENNIVPILTLEMVSHTPGGEYDEKLEIYQKLGVLYYLIYNPDYYKRDNHQAFEIYKLVNGVYQLQSGEPFWMAEIGLGIGRKDHNLNGISRELLYWYDERGTRYLSADEIAEIEKQRADIEKQRADSEALRAEIENQRADSETLRAEKLAQRLRELGENPDDL